MNPITGVVGCCACAASGHAAVPPSRPMKVRRFMCGWPPPGKRSFGVQRRGRLQSCVRPVGAVRWTAGPDGVREPSPHHSNGIDVPMKRQVWLGCVGIDRLCHHASLLSRKLQNVAQRPKPPRPRAGSSHAGASPPRRCARSCWLARRLRPAAVAADGARSPTDRHWSSSSVAN